MPISKLSSTAGGMRVLGIPDPGLAGIAEFVLALDHAEITDARIFSTFGSFENNVAVPDQTQAWEVLEPWDKPFLCCFSNGHPVTRCGESRFIGRVPGTAGQVPRPLTGGYFIQEYHPRGFVDCILKAASAKWGGCPARSAHCSEQREASRLG